MENARPKPSVQDLAAALDAQAAAATTFSEAQVLASQADALRRGVRLAVQPFGMPILRN